jgi:AraC-like DNA-binding protein
MSPECNKSTNNKNHRDVVIEQRDYILAENTKGVSLERIAEELGMSTASLQRHTRDWGLRRAISRYSTRTTKPVSTPVSPEIKRLAVSLAW